MIDHAGSQHHSLSGTPELGRKILQENVSDPAISRPREKEALGAQGRGVA